MFTKNIEISSLVLVFLLVLFASGSPGCLLQKTPDQSQLNSSPPMTVNNSTVPVPIVQAPGNTPTIPPNQSGVRMFMDAELVCIGQNLAFGLVNGGNSTISFGVENPYWIQFNNNGIWGNIFNGGGFQGSWQLHPGDEVKRGWAFTNFEGNGLNEWYNQTDPTRVFTVRPGLYRIMIFGINKETNESFTVAKEFTIHECRSNPSRTRLKSVAVSVEKQGQNIIITNDGGPDARDVTSFVVTIDDGTPIIAPELGITVGLSHSFAGTPGLKNRVLVNATFKDGSEQLILDTAVV